MGAKGAVEIIFREDKGEPAAGREEAEYKARFANPFVPGLAASSTIMIQPHETRKRICKSGDAEGKKREPVAQARQHSAVSSKEKPNV
jgi:acetyl-CoA carboxylase carboxyltransferase component